MDYDELAKKYKPKKTRTLLIGETPPKKDLNYFYNVREYYRHRKLTIESDNSLQATIFNHYFNKRPNNTKDYEAFLKCLQKRRIFLIDIVNEKIDFHDKDDNVVKKNIKKLTSKKNLDNLQIKINAIQSNDGTTQIIFLLARPQYLKKLRRRFKTASFITWKCFRLDIREAKSYIKKTSP